MTAWLFELTAIFNPKEAILYMQFAETVVFPVPGGPWIANTVFFCEFINSAI